MAGVAFAPRTGAQIVAATPMPVMPVMPGMLGMPGLRVPGVWQTVIAPSGIIMLPGMAGMPASYGQVYWVPSVAGMAVGGPMYGSMGMFGMFPVAAMYGGIGMYGMFPMTAMYGLSPELPPTFGIGGLVPAPGMTGGPSVWHGVPGTPPPLTGFFTMTPAGELIFYPDPPVMR